MTSPDETEMLSANVNPRTGLATDYLNLFNEAIMLFEMGLDMPEIGEDLAEWKPRSYVEHFENSGFEHRDTVIRAYLTANADTRDTFDQACGRACACFDSAIDIFLSSNVDDETARKDLEGRLREMKAWVSELDGHIHGRVHSGAEARTEVDALF